MTDYDLSNLHVLIVDDYQPMRHILRGILWEWRILRIREATSGQEALDMLKNFHADIIIADYQMSPMNGLELARTIRLGETDVDPYLPIILITAYTEMQTILEARDAGVNEFLAKPISAKNVYDRIRSIIENPRPIVQSNKFIGPDRRRRTVSIAGEDRRASGQETIEVEPT